jgi:mannose-6-phosphate isomerase class I
MDGPPPILLKRLEVEAVLSVQCHPRAGSPLGTKEEIWYFLEAPDEGFVYAGLAPGATIEAVLAARREDLSALLLHLPVRRGEVLRLPSGIVHALTPGARVFEIQEPNEVTIRLHDWGRGRPTDPEAARREADPSLFAERLGSLEAPNGEILLTLGRERIRLQRSAPPAGIFSFPLDEAGSGYAVLDNLKGQG